MALGAVVNTLLVPLVALGARQIPVVLRMRILFVFCLRELHNLVIETVTLNANLVFAFVDHLQFAAGCRYVTHFTLHAFGTVAVSQKTVGGNSRSGKSGNQDTGQNCFCEAVLHG